MAEVVEGMDDFLKSLDALPLHVQEKLAANAIRAALKPVKERAAGKARGSLKDKVKIVIDRSDPKNVRGGVGFTSKGFYGRFQYGHEGTGQGKRPRGQGRKRSTRDQYRIILRAWDQSRGKMIETLGKRLGKGIEREFKRLNPKARR